MAKVMRKEARHTQRRDRASGLELLAAVKFLWFGICSFFSLKCSSPAARSARGWAHPETVCTLCACWELRFSRAATSSSGGPSDRPAGPETERATRPSRREPSLAGLARAASPCPAPGYLVRAAARAPAPGASTLRSVWARVRVVPCLEGQVRRKMRGLG